MSSGDHYICNSCDYEWRTRKYVGKPYQCPKCKSNDILSIVEKMLNTLRKKIKKEDSIQKQKIQDAFINSVNKWFIEHRGVLTFDSGGDWLQYTLNHNQFCLYLPCAIRKINPLDVEEILKSFSFLKVDGFGPENTYYIEEEEGSIYANGGLNIEVLVNLTNQIFLKLLKKTKIINLTLNYNLKLRAKLSSCP